VGVAHAACIATPLTPPPGRGIWKMPFLPRCRAGHPVSARGDLMLNRCPLRSWVIRYAPFILFPLRVSCVDVS